MRFDHLAKMAAVLAFCVVASATTLAQSIEPAPADDVMSLKAGRGADGAISLSWTVAPGIYLYRDKIAASSGGNPVTVVTPSAKSKDDPTFGTVEIYDADFTARVDTRQVDLSKPLDVTFQGCADRGVCYPPITQQVDLARIANAGDETAATYKEAPLDGDLQVHVADDVQPQRDPASAPAGLAPDLKGDMAVVIATFFGLGLLLALTPCLYPMIPILVGVLARSGETLSAMRGFALASSYVIAMAAAYGALGVAAAWSGQNLQTALQTPIALTLVSVAFVALALSMFGAFQLQAPAAIGSRLSSVASRARGSMLGAALLGFVSALIVGPCVTPPLAAALVYVAQTGDVLRGSSALFAMGLGMGAPLVAVGVFGSKILPKSGRWLETIKHGFGVVFLAFAIMLMGRVAPPAVTLAAWAVFAIGLGVFLGAFDAMNRRSTVARRLSKAAGVAAIFYGAALVVGATSGADDALRPLARLAMAQPAVDRPSELTVTNIGDLKAALSAARASGKPSVVMFTASWCVACAENDQAIESSQALRDRLREFAFIKVDVSKNDDQTTEVMRSLNVVGPPTALIYDRTGTEISQLRSTGVIDVASFDNNLKRALLT